MRTLVTGGAGFIGSHLVEYLLDRGDDVTVLDDLSTGRVANLAAVSEHPRLRFVEGNVCDQSTVDKCMSDVDVVFHLAAAVGVFTIMDRTLESLRTNLLGTENVLDAAGRHGVRMLLASTSEIYGKNTTVGLTEDADRIVGSPLLDRWSYAEAKAVDETLTYLHTAERGLRAVIVRLFNTVGPRQSGRYGMVVPRFVGQALAGEPLTVFGTGQQIRCFCHVLDVVPSMVALLDATVPGQDTTNGRVFNLGSAEQVSIRGLATRVITALGSTSPIDTVPYERAYGTGYEDMERRVPDCARARERVGFAPARDLDDIIDSVAAERRHANAIATPS